VDFQIAENKISLEYIWAYPPGIPLLVPGERINKDIINKVEQMRASNVEIYSSKGLFENNLGKIYTVIND
jgi:arginine/lysine/ornithine decarboxylase